MQTQVNYIYHTTSVNALYRVLDSDYLLPRAETNALRGFSSVGKGDGRYVYLTLNDSKPMAGEKCVQIVLNGKLLTERFDYILNTEWMYGPSSNSLPYTKVDEFLKTKTSMNEILFFNGIYLPDNIIEITVTQLSPEIMEMLPSECYNKELFEIDINKIKDLYRGKIKIIY